MHRKAWGAASAVVALFTIPMIRLRSASPGLLTDSDTVALLHAIRERDNPWSWFVGDWPLFNHFYRPLSTLTFEVDNSIWGSNPAGYGLTNLLIALAAIVSLFWLLREVTDSPALTSIGTILFALWHTGLAHEVAGIAGTWAPGVVWVGTLLAQPPGPWPQRLGRAVALATFTALLGHEIGGMQPLAGRIITWLPGRTASVMTVFALVAMAAYARGGRRRLEAGPHVWPWNALCLLAVALALGSYEQAVMLPGLLVGLAVCDRIRQRPVRWAVPALAWGLLFGYLALRHAVVPSTVSGYQAQQFRDGPGVFLSAMEYAFPAASFFPVMWSFRDMGGTILFTDIPLQFTLTLAGWILLAVRGWRTDAGRLALTGWALSTLAFLPMAWMQPFEHYHYWPMALRTWFVLGVGGVLFDTVRAWWMPDPNVTDRPTPQSP